MLHDHVHTCPVASVAVRSRARVTGKCCCACMYMCRTQDRVVQILDLPHTHVYRKCGGGSLVLVWEWVCLIFCPAFIVLCLAACRRAGEGGVTGCFLWPFLFLDAALSKTRIVVNHTECLHHGDGPRLVSWMSTKSGVECRMTDRYHRPRRCGTPPPTTYLSHRRSTAHV